MTKEEAYKVWEHEFGKVEYAHDFTGRKIKKEDYEVENQVGWVVTYVCPLKKGGKDNIENMVITNHITAYEKGDNFPKFTVIDTNYEIKYDEVEDFYFIEKETK